MSNRNQRVGTEYESSLLPLLLEYMPKTHRLGKQGANDKGDFWTPDPRYVIEAKRERDYAGKLGGYIGEAEREARNAEKPHGIVIFKRSGTTDPAKQYVLTTLGSFLELAHGSGTQIAGSRSARVCKSTHRRPAGHRERGSRPPR